MLTFEKLLGVWSLLAFQIEPLGQEKRNWNNQPKGILIYTSLGYMSVTISGEIKGEKTKENKFNSTLCYAGTFNVINEKTILHHITTASEPDRIGTQMFRKAILEDNNGLLTLIGEGDFGTATLLWKRITN